MSDHSAARDASLQASPIGFGIVTRNRASYLRDCLVSIDASALEAALSNRIPIAVLDNSDGDDSRRLIEQLAPELPMLDLRYARTAPARDVLSAGRNACATNLETELIAFVDDDVVIARGWLSACLESFRDPGVAAVTGRILEPNTVALDPDADLPIGQILPDGRMTAHFYLRRNSRVQVQHVRGCNWVCRRALFMAVGGFASAFEHVFEEADLSLRLTRANHRIFFVPGVEVDHRCGPRSHPLRQDAPALFFARARAEMRLYTLMLLRNFGPTSPVVWRYLFTRETGLKGLLRAPSWLALREAVNNAAGKFSGILRSLRRSREYRVLPAQFVAIRGTADPASSRARTGPPS